MAVLPILREPASDSFLARYQKEQSGSSGAFGPSDVLFPPRQIVPGLLPRCGRFVCALCDLQLGKEHVCPACFERGRGGSVTEAGKGEWRHRDVLFDSIAMTIGWVWILVRPAFVAALPTVIFLHVKYRKAPGSYLIPRSGWRFWAAYGLLAWMPLLIVVALIADRMARRH